LLKSSTTSSAVIQGILLCLTAYPKVQEKAQAEIDWVIGPDRVPGWDDLEKLTYVKALIEEV